jgi:hypothetical protein
MNHTGRIQRVRVTVNDEAAFPENIFEEIESSLLGIEVDKWKMIYAEYTNAATR